MYIRVTAHFRVGHIRNVRRYPLSAFGILPVGVVMCVRAVEHDEVAFSDLSIAVSWLTRSANAWIQGWWHTVLRKLSTSVRIVCKNLVGCKLEFHCLFLEVILHWLRYVWGLSVSVVRSWEVSASVRSSMVKSIGGKWSVRCEAVVHFSEDRLLEVSQSVM